MMSVVYRFLLRLIPGAHFSKKKFHGSLSIHVSHLEKVKCEMRISLHGLWVIRVHCCPTAAASHGRPFCRFTGLWFEKWEMGIVNVHFSKPEIWLANRETSREMWIHFLEKCAPEPETLKTGILVLVPLPTFRGPTSQSKMSGYEKFPHPTSHFSFPISLIRSIAQNSWNILNTTVYGALGTLSNGPISHLMWDVWCEIWEVGIVNAYIPFLTWHLRSGKWDSNEDSRF